MRKLVIICSIFLLCSCSSKRVMVLNTKDIYGFNITESNLADFHDTARIDSYVVKNKYIHSELQYIKQHLEDNENRDLLPGSIYSYAFIIETDTIYGNAMLNYWFYKNRAIRYDNPKINTKLARIKKTL